MIRLLAIIFAATLIVSACTADSSHRLGASNAEQDVIGDVSGLDGSFRPASDSGDVDPSDSDVAAADVEDDSSANGGFLEPCDEDADCLSGYCVLFDGARVCT
jgi:hypothetical protein